MVAGPGMNDHPSVAPELLDQVADRAYAVLGPCNGRLVRAVAMVRSGAVNLLPTGYVEVQSQSTDELTYTVNGSCPDAQHWLLMGTANTCSLPGWCAVSTVPSPRLPQPTPQQSPLLLPSQKPLHRSTATSR